MSSDDQEQPTDPRERLLAVLDRSLTTPTRAVKIAAGWSPATIVAYIEAWVAFVAWCRPPRGLSGEPPARWLTPMPCTPETLALFALYLLAERGLAIATVRKMISGVRAWHRLHGQPVPDGVPALSVLTEHQRTLEAAGWEQKHTTPLRIDDVVRLVEPIDRSTPRGMRDVCLVLLGYAAALKPHRLAELRIRDVTDSAGGLYVRRGGDDDQAVTLPHWTLGGAHRGELCPVESTVAWARYLIDRGADPSTALIRGVDQHGRVSGLDEQWLGKLPADGQVDRSSLAYALAGILADSGIEAPQRFSLYSLRAGGLAHRRYMGATLRELVDVGDLSPRSSVLLDHVATAEAWAAGDADTTN